MNIIKQLISPSLCYRCRVRSTNFLCKRCLLGIELGSLEKEGKVGHLFSEGADFLLADKEKYKDTLICFVLIQLEKFKWQFNKIVVEPELIFLKKGLEKYKYEEVYKTLYIVHDCKEPILLEPVKGAHLVLII